VHSVYEGCVGVSGYELTIQDERPGNPKEQLGSLFRLFGVSADGFGFGLGLSIGHRAIVVHGGTIASSDRQPLASKHA